MQTSALDGGTAPQGRQAAITAQQIALYGEPLAARFGRLLATFRIPQARLAAVIGLSAPMLSQLASAQRVKISNPAVYARLLRLEELALTTVGSDAGRLALALDEVAASRPRLTTERIATTAETSEHLADIATPAELERAAAAVATTRLGELLSSAAERARRQSRARTHTVVLR